MTRLPDVGSVTAELERRGVVLPEGPVRLDAYGDSPALEAELIGLIRSGKKRGTSALVWSYEAEGSGLPQAGDIEIVIDSSGSPRLVTRVLFAEVVPFSEVTEEHAALEGEGDLSLLSWQQKHWDFFERECAQIARRATPEMPIVCLQFELLSVLS
ncbi:MAG: ASCH domain-containing protein [Acidobacteriota bacterium]